jgi:hypothetical protein
MYSLYITITSEYYNLKRLSCFLLEMKGTSSYIASDYPCQICVQSRGVKVENQLEYFDNIVLFDALLTKGFQI